MQSRHFDMNGTVSALWRCNVFQCPTSLEEKEMRQCSAPDEIQCINKSDRPNPHERASASAAVILTAQPDMQQEAVGILAKRSKAFYVKRGGLILRRGRGDEPIWKRLPQDAGRREVPDNLLRLPRVAEDEGPSRLAPTARQARRLSVRDQALAIAESRPWWAEFTRCRVQSR